MSPPERIKMRLAIAIFFLIVQLSGAAAQTSEKNANKPAPPAKNAVVDQNAKTPTYGDWQIHCSTPTQPKAQRSCEAVQQVFAKNQAQPFAQIAFGKPASNEPLLVTVVLPVNVVFSNNVKIFNAENDAHPADLSWRRCVPVGCFANFALNEETLKRWKASDTSGKITFKNAAGQEIAIPISFKGLGQALDAMAKQP
jgi:invasion protein IalB